MAGERRGVAPTLRWHFDQDVFASARDALREDAPQMRRELRALLAVARAAERDWCDFCDGYHSDVAADDAAWRKAGGRVCSIGRALARLRRSGGAGRAR